MQAAPLLALTIVQIVLVWLIFQIMLLGWGALVHRAFAGRLTRGRDWLVAFWAGWAIVIILLQVWHLFGAINTAAFAAFGMVGLIGCVVNRQELTAILKQLPAYPLAAAATLSGALLIANAAMAPVVDGDYAFYQQQVVMWNSEYAIVPGLGNLHGRFAFNNAGLLWVALADAAPLLEIGRHIAGSLPAVNLLVLTVFSARRVLTQSRPAQADVFGALLLPLAAWLPNSVYMSNPESDLAPLLFGVVIGWMLWQLWQAEPIQQSQFWLVVITLLGVAGVVSKVSFGAPGGFAVLLAYWIHWRRYRWRPAWLGPTVITLAGVVFSIWGLRSVILSGYVAYPLDTLSFNVDWRVSCLEARRDQQLIYAFARTAITPGTTDIMPGWGWLSQWILWAFRYSFRFTTPLVLSVIALLTWIVTPYRRRREKVILLVPLLSIAVWFFTAPDPRFIASSMWTLSNSALILMLLPITERNPKVAKIIVGVIVGGLTLWQVINFTPFSPYPERGFYPTPPLATTALQTDSGLTINIPTTRLSDDPLAADRCYAADLPCTPYFDAALTLRASDQIQAGFRDDDALTCEEAMSNPSLFRPTFAAADE